jgi:hypothetical protein
MVNTFLNLQKQKSATVHQSEIIRIVILSDSEGSALIPKVEKEKTDSSSQGFSE